MPTLTKDVLAACEKCDNVSKDLSRKVGSKKSPKGQK